MKYVFRAHFFLLFFIWACSSTSNGSHGKKVENQKVSIDEIEFEDWGPPVAPRYNETFSIILNRREGTLVIDSARTAGIEIQKPLSANDFDRILELKYANNISIGEALSFDGCVGGRGQTLTLRFEGKDVAQGVVINCGGEQRSNISGNLASMTQAMRKLAFGNQ